METNNWLPVVLDIFWTLCAPALVAAAGLILQELRKHGYRTALADAIVRAAGEGQIAATQAGLSLAGAAGRAVAVKAGVQYLKSTVPDALVHFCLDDADTAVRVQAQIGTQPAVAVALAAPAASPSPVEQPAAMTVPGPVTGMPVKTTAEAQASTGSPYGP